VPVQGTPFASLTMLQLPLPSHVEEDWQPPDAGQEYGAPAQLPKASHRSAEVQGLPSSQSVAARAFWSVQRGTPVAHDSTPTWQGRGTGRVHAFPGMQSLQTPE
jgi:hypothetical protein